MDQFESLIGTLLESEGYWVRHSYRVRPTKEEKHKVKKPTLPNPEIDILAFDFSKNIVLAIEVKSFLDSSGVKLEHLQEEHDNAAGIYKLFTSKLFRSVILSRLLQDLIDDGMANSKTVIKLGLAAGKTYKKQDELIRQHMDRMNWFFWSPEDIKTRITALAEGGYSDNMAAMTAKILMRKTNP